MASGPYEVNLDSGEDSPLDNEVNEALAISGLLVEGLLVEDDSAKVLLNPRGSEEQLTVRTTVLLIVLHVDRRETLPNGPSAAQN